MLFQDYLLQKHYMSKELYDVSKKEFEQQKRDRKTLSFGEYLCNENRITEKELIQIYREFTGAEFVDLNQTSVGKSKIFLPKVIAREHGMFCLREQGDEIYLVIKDPTDLKGIQKAKHYTGKRIHLCVSFLNSINEKIEEIYGNEDFRKAALAMEEKHGDAAAKKAQFLNIQEDERNPATIRTVNSIIRQALNLRASDIHIEAGEKNSLIRVRVDGMLMELQKVEATSHAAIIARIKVMGGMDVAEKRIPQDGRSEVSLEGEKIDLRISTLPTVHGEKAVIRLLQKTKENRDKESIGLSPGEMQLYNKMLENSNGVILIVGPTGSGKSTTMTTMIRTLNKPEVNIVTLEDPVEYNLSQVNQVQISEKTGMTFAKGLRATMRQDPDIIGIGEIRDGETADIAMRSALTGHLVISTLHTNNAIASFERLKDIGVDEYLYASALIGIISQRLVRKICINCKEPVALSGEDLTFLGFSKNSLDKITFYRGRGCSCCQNTGYRGRTGVFEILVMSREIRRAVASGADEEEIKRIAEKEGYRSLRESCFQLIQKGITTVEEMKRITNIVE